MSVARYNPFDFTPFQAFRLFEDAATQSAEPSASRPWAGAVDILETKDALVLKEDLPEVKLENIDIRVEDGTLTMQLEAVENEKG